MVNRSKGPEYKEEKSKKPLVPFFDFICSNKDPGELIEYLNKIRSKQMKNIE